MKLEMIVLKESDNANKGQTVVLVPLSNSSENEVNRLIGAKIRLDFDENAPKLFEEGERFDIEITAV
jgi:hypothetical protein